MLRPKKSSWLDDNDEPADPVRERIVELRAERLALDVDGIERLGSHAAAMRRVAEIQEELRRLERQQDGEPEPADTDEALGPRQLVRPPADLLNITFPPRKFAIAPLYPVQCCSTLVAEGGTGKSTEVLNQLLHVAAGIPYQGLAVERGTVVYVSCEDERTEIWRRVQRLARHLPPEAQQRALSNFYLLDRVGKRSHFVITSSGGTPMITTGVTELANYILRHVGKPRLIAVDTIARVNGAVENSNGHVGTGRCRRADSAIDRAGRIVVLNGLSARVAVAHKSHCVKGASKSRW